MDQVTVYLGMGSNLGDRAANLLRGISLLPEVGLRLRVVSPIYETAPVDYLEQPPFLNLVVVAEWAGGDAWNLMGSILGIEARLGRRREILRGPRTIDIDLLLFGNLVAAGVREGVDLVLPHPRMHERRFVLLPLGKIAPDLVHPVLGLTPAQMLAGLDDDAAVDIYRG